MFTFLIPILSSFALAAEKPAPAQEDFKRFSIDLGGSSNFNQDSSVFEANVGVNYYVMRWLVWRNAPFYRSQTGMNAAFGLDSSLQGVFRERLAEGIEPNLRLGGGYRVINIGGSSAPFLEGGAGLNVQGITVGASAKRIFHSVVTTGMANETLYSLTFSGGTSF